MSFVSAYQFTFQSAPIFLFPKPISFLKPRTQHFSSNTEFTFKSIINPQSRTRICYSRPNLDDDFNSRNSGNETFAFCNTFARWVCGLKSFLPGGSWWDLSGHEEIDEGLSEKTKKNTVLAAVTRMWALIGDDRWVVLVAFGSLIVAAISEISMPNLLATSIFSAQNGQTVIFNRNCQLLLLMCFVSGICSGLRNGCFGIANTILVKRLRENLYAVLMYQDINFFDTTTVGDLTSRLGADCHRLSHVIVKDLNLILRNTLQGTGALINLLTLSWPLSMSALVVCLVLSSVLLIYGRYQERVAKLTQDFTAHANEVTEETFSLIRTVRIYGTEKRELERYKEWLEKLADLSVRESTAYAFWTLCFNTLYRSTQVIAVLVGGMSILTGHVTAEQLTKYILYCEWLIYATWRITDNFSSLMQSIGASEPVFHLMDLMPSNQFVSKGLKFEKVIGHIEFANLSFCYPSRPAVPVLRHLNFSVQPNEIVAIVGPSGSGKSTLVNLLLRLYEPTNGKILVDGFPLRELDIRWLRHNVGFVGQEPRLFNMDIISNICYGYTADLKQDDVERAAKLAHAHEFISSLPNGYRTLVHDSLLSGGQKQRIAIARAILRDTPILILDEATSALDAESEHYIKEVIQALGHDCEVKRTIIVIAHRLSTAKVCDRIIVMDGGQIVEDMSYSKRWGICTTEQSTGKGSDLS